MMEITLELEEEAYEQLASRAEQHEFESPEEYGAVIIKTVLSEIDSEEEDDVRNRLEDLGYL